jgi:predicted RNA-binding protein with TRAM domain
VWRVLQILLVLSPLRILSDASLSSLAYMGVRQTLVSVFTMSYGRNRDSRGNSGNRGFGFGGGRPSMGPKPVEEGKEYEVEVTELSRRGDGVAKIQGFVIFVQGAKVGQKVKIKVERVGPRFASATVVGASSESS